MTPADALRWAIEEAADLEARTRAAAHACRRHPSATVRQSTADKNLARQRACERWPESSGLFARAKDADRAEAALVAEYGRRTGL